MLFQYFCSRTLLTTHCREESDRALQASMRALDKIIAERHQNRVDLGIQEEQSTAVKNAYSTLCMWIASCSGKPRRWEQYCAWPSSLQPEFFDAIANCNEIALLLLVYWCAFLYRAPQPSTHLWAYRTAQYALSRQPNRDTWKDLLSWPMNVLTAPLRNPFQG